MTEVEKPKSHRARKVQKGGASTEISEKIAALADKASRRTDVAISGKSFVSAPTATGRIRIVASESGNYVVLRNPSDKGKARFAGEIWEPVEIDPRSKFARKKPEELMRGNRKFVLLEKFREGLRTASFEARVQIERKGVPSEVVREVIEESGITNSEFRRFVSIPKATFTKKMKDKAPFDGATGLSVVGLLDLINKVEEMLSSQEEGGGAEHFDAVKWVGHWIQKPQPALGGKAPAEVLDTPSGRASVMKILGAIQSGAYQ